jgi:uncharacterized membrane protein YcaP (DUF421 family)
MFIHMPESAIPGPTVWRLLHGRVVRRTIVLTGKQWVGLPMLGALPVLALAGILGPGRAAVVGRVALVYAFLLAALRILGKRELSQMTPFDAVLLFLIPQIFRNYLIGTDNSLVTALVGATTLLVLVFLTSLVGFRSPSAGRLVRATPTVLLDDGVLRERELERERITPEEIEAAARRAGVDGLAQVRRATLESDGTISVIRRTSPP